MVWFLLQCDPMKQEIVFNFSSPESSHGFLLYKVYATWEGGIKNVLKKHNLTHPQFVILTTTAWFVTFEEAPTQKALSEKTGIDVMTTSVIIQSLIKKWYIQRTPATEDKRAYKISLTEIGKKKVQESMDAVDTYDKAFFSTLSEDEKHNLSTLFLKFIK